MKYKYDAFISYRHTERDRLAAENLHRQMEAFRLPGKLSGKAAGRTRIERVFRDRDELPLTNNLEDPIMEALAQSEYLIVICSPRLRESLWCRKEIETFIRMHGREKVLAVLIEGEPAESFPEELLYKEETVTAEDGSVSTVRRAMEPLAADIRGKNRREMLKALKTEKLRLLAPMFSLDYDDLKQRHRERRMKRILGASLGAAALFLCFGTFSTAMALRIRNQNRQLEEQKDRLQVQKEQLEEQATLLKKQSDEILQQNESLLEGQALNLAEDSLRLLEAGDRTGAIRRAVQSLTEYDGIQMPYTARGEYALTESLHIYDSGTYIKPRHQMETEGVIWSMRLSPDRERLLTCDATRTLTLWNIAEGSRICVRRNCEAFLSEKEDYCFLDNDRIAYIDDAGGVTVYDWQREEAESFLEGSFPRGMEAAGGLLAVQYTGEIRIYRTDTLEYLGNYVKEGFYGIPGKVYIDGERKIVVFQETATEEADPDDPRRLVFWDIESGRISKTEADDCWIDTVAFGGNTAYVLCSYTGDDYFSMEAGLMACDMDTGAALWKNVYADCGGSTLFLPSAEGADKFLAVTSYDARLIGREDGREYARFSMGSSVAGGAVFTDGDLYTLYTRSGEFHSILTEKLMDYVVENRFQSHSQNVKEFQVCRGGYLVLPYQDNRVTLYTYSENPAYEKLSEPVEPAQGEGLDYSLAVEFAGEKGLDMPALVNYVFYSGDGTLLYVCYNNEQLKIYDAESLELKTELALKSPFARNELGVDERGNRFVGGGGYGYMLSPGLELLAVIEDLKAVDPGRNRLIVGDSGGDQYEIPIYTVEELLDNARGYVLSCNYSEPDQADFE